jgi:hypothetical protein
MGLPPHGWLIREHLMKIDELGVYLHLWNLHIYVYIYMAEISCNNNHILGIDIPVLDKLKKRRSGVQFASSRGGISPTELTWEDTTESNWDEPP